MRALSRRSFQRWSAHPRKYIIALKQVNTIDGRRKIQIEAAPSSDSTGVVENTSGQASNPDAVFEVVGTPYSLLSVTLSASQALHSRRGTLVGLSGDPTTAVSTLRLLSPVRRALVGIPFLYQRLTSATPVTALISPKSTCTSLAVLHLTGTTDWKIAQRNALLAWTGTTMVLNPSIRDLHSTSISSWGSTGCTGRGLLALEGKGNIFSITLTDKKETYITHPSNVLAYSIPGSFSNASTGSQSPIPYRFKSSAFNLTIPTPPYIFTNIFPPSRFITNLKNSDTYRLVSTILHRIRTWSRRTIWGDRLFVRFTGPTTILVQSRASRLRDVLTDRQIDDIADTPAGAATLDNGVSKTPQRSSSSSSQTTDRASAAAAGRGGREGEAGGASVSGATSFEATTTKTSSPRQTTAPKLSIATVQRDGNVRVEPTSDFTPASVTSRRS